MHEGVNFEVFLYYYQNPKTEALIKEDFMFAEKYKLEIVPALVIEKNHSIVGTKQNDLAIKLLKEAAQADGLFLTEA